MREYCGVCYGGLGQLVREAQLLQHLQCCRVSGVPGGGSCFHQSERFEEATHPPLGLLLQANGNDFLVEQLPRCEADGCVRPRLVPVVEGGPRIIAHKQAGGPEMRRAPAK